MAMIHRAMQRLLPAPRPSATPVRADGRKVVLGEYYAALSSAGAYPAYRARNWPVERAVSEAYEKVVWIYKAAEAIASAASRLPFELKQGEETLDDHPLYRVLNKQANPMETGRQFRKRLSSQILLSKKGAFVEITKSRGGDIVRMDLLPPGRTTPIPGKGQDLLSHYEVLRIDGSRYTIEPERVRWYRDPHPLDPYSGVTPLEAAGMSIELDFLTRLHNLAFLKNDARPGGVLAVKDVMGEEEMDRIEARFSRGAPNAGTLTVINGQVTYTDLATQPRDMQYETTSSIAKKEILTAFGVPESVIGDASGRTFDNAEQEEFNFWSITMPPHLDILTTGLDADSEDALKGGFNTDGIAVLQRTKVARRAEAREEFAAGLISAKEYRNIAGYEEIDTEHTRSLYMPSGRTEIPTSDADKKLMEEEASKKFEQQQQAAMQQAAARGGNAAPGGKEKPSGPQDGPRGGGQPKAQEGQTRGATAAKAYGFTGARRPSVRLIRPAEAKAAEPARESALDTEARDRLEAALETALAALMVRLTARAAARLLSTKARKHTRHWRAEFPDDSRLGAKTIDAEQAVDGARWEEETEQAASPLVEAAAVAAAMALLADLGGPALSAAEIAVLADPAVSGVLRMLRASAARQAARLVTLVRDADLSGQGIDDMVMTVRTYAAKTASWAKAVAVQAATAAVNGARETAARATEGNRPVSPTRGTGGTGEGGETPPQVVEITRTWRHRGDSRVRETHRAAGGQLRPLGAPFRVGNALLRYPGDEEGPPEETHGCRCWLLYRSTVSGRFLPAPAGEVTRNPFRKQPVAAEGGA